MWGDSLWILESDSIAVFQSSTLSALIERGFGALYALVKEKSGAGWAGGSLVVRDGLENGGVMSSANRGMHVSNCL